MPGGIGGKSWVSKNAGGVGVIVGNDVAVAVGVAVEVAVAVGGTGVDVAVGNAVAVNVADGAITVFVTVGSGVVVGCVVAQDARSIAVANPPTTKQDFMLFPNRLTRHQNFAGL